MGAKTPGSSIQEGPEWAGSNQWCGRCCDWFPGRKSMSLLSWSLSLSRGPERGDKDKDQNNDKERLLALLGHRWDAPCPALPQEHLRGQCGRKQKLNAAPNSQLSTVRPVYGRARPARFHRIRWAHGVIVTLPRKSAERIGPKYRLSKALVVLSPSTT